MFKSLNNYRYLGMEGLPQEIFIENFAVNAEFIYNRTREITVGACLMSITEIVSDCQEIDTRALLIINNYILGFLWGNQCFLVFGTHTKEECPPQVQQFY